MKLDKNLRKIQADSGLKFRVIPKSPSHIDIGSILSFKYLKISRLVLVVKPVSKIPGTGNLLLTCVNIPLDKEFDLETARNLYKNRSSLGEDQYRTYIMSNIQGSLKILYSEDSEIE